MCPQTRKKQPDGLIHLPVVIITSEETASRHINVFFFLLLFIMNKNNVIIKCKTIIWEIKMI